MQLKRLLHGVYLLLLIATSATAQTDSLTVSLNSGGGANYAMIVGISKYKHIRPLTYADKDAELFRDYLKTPGAGSMPEENIFCLLNEEAQAGNFWAKGFAWLRSKNLKKGDRLYLYFAGHGDAISPAEYFFLTYECNPAGDKNNYLAGGNIQLYNVKNRIAEQVNNGVEVLLIMDACRSNELPGGNEGQQILNAAISEKKTGEIMMLATGAGQESLEDAAIGTGHGLFTYYLVDGLTGLADRGGNNNQRITLAELQSYINSNVPVIALEKYNRKQEPFFCCEEKNENNIALVDSVFLNQWSIVKQLNDGSKNELQAMAYGNAKGRSLETGISDTQYLSNYYKFTHAIQISNLLDNDSSAAAHLAILNGIDSTHNMSKEAKAALAAALINYAQTKINLYLQGKDALAVQQIRTQLDDLHGQNDMDATLTRMEKVARQDFAQTGHLLEQAINYLDVKDSSFTQSLKAKVYFFKAHGFFDKGNKTMDYVEALRFARRSNEIDSNAAYTLNTMASLFIQNKQLDSAIFYAKQAVALAPEWRYPYLNIAYAYTKMNIRDSALPYYLKALEVDSSNADAYVDLGRFYYQWREMDAAIQQYNKAFKLDANNLYAHNNMGWILRELKQYPQSIQHFRTSIAIDSTLFSSYNGLSKVFTELKQFDSARIYYQKAMQKYPDKTVTSNYLGNFYKSIRQYDSAFHYYKMAAQYDTDDPIPYINIAKTYTELKQRDSAIHYYLMAAATPNGAPLSYTQLGTLYKELKKLDSAALYFTRASALQPDYSPAINNLALIYTEQKKYDSAHHYYRKAIQFDPYNAHLYNNAGFAYKEMFKLDSAKTYLKKAISLNPSIESAYNNLGWLYRTQQKFDSAKVVFKDGLNKNPYNTEALNNLVLLYKYLNQLDSARILYQQNIERYPGNLGAINSLGNFYFDVKSYDSAILTYKKGLRYDSSYALAYNNLGVVYNEINWYDSAVYFYKKAILLDSNYTNAYFNTGMSYYNASKFDSAIVYLKKAVQLNPENKYYDFFLAGCYALKKYTTESMFHITSAMEKGYDDYYTLLHDEDLKILHGIPAYKDLVKKYVPEKFMKQLQDEINRQQNEGKPPPAPTNGKKKRKG